MPTSHRSSTLQILQSKGVEGAKYFGLRSLHSPGLGVRTRIRINANLAEAALHVVTETSNDSTRSVTNSSEVEAIFE